MFSNIMFYEKMERVMAGELQCTSEYSVVCDKVSTPPTIKVTFYCYQLELAKTVTGLYT